MATIVQRQDRVRIIAQSRTHHPRVLARRLRAGVGLVPERVVGHPAAAAPRAALAMAGSASGRIPHVSRSRTRRSPRLDELRLAVPEERFEAGLVFGRHADRVGELRRWCTSATDKTRVATPLAVASRERAPAPASSSLPTDDEGKSPSTLRSRPLQTPRARAGTATSRTVEPRRTASVLRASRQTPGWGRRAGAQDAAFPLDEAAARERPLGAPLATAQDVKEE
jgi:hypothetical protein